MEIADEAHRPGVAMNRGALPDRDRGMTQAGLPRVLADYLRCGFADRNDAAGGATGCRTSLRAGAGESLNGKGAPQ